MSKVRIVQLLCPSRHCILAAAYESPDGEAIPENTTRIADGFEQAVNKGLLNPWCYICESRDLRPEDMPTKFATMAEAAPFLAKASAEQAAVRQGIEAYKKASRN